MTVFNFDALKSGVCIVTFTKKDGTERVMRCTQDMDYLANSNLPLGTGLPYTNEQVRVFDLEKAEWRSFLRNSVISLKVEA
jgi:hypothetical protein